MSITTKPCGLRVVGEKIPNFRSTALGIWVQSGSVSEDAAHNGISHFIEHMVFKGTKNRSALDIVSVIDAVGGNLNAFTTKDLTCFYVKVMDEHVPLAMDVLFDLIKNPLLTEESIQREKAVVVEEIAMVEDTPDDLVHELLAEAFFGQHPLSRPILGTQETVMAMNREDIVQYMHTWYQPANMVFSIAGNYDEAMVDRELEKHLEGWGADASLMGKTTSREMVFGTRNTIIRTKNTEQVHVSLGYPGISNLSDDIYPMLLLNNVLGGGMSSRLFQKIREQRGLAYSIYSYPVSYADGGVFSIYVGLGAGSLDETMDLIRQEIELLKKGDMTATELEASKEQMKGNYILGLDSTSSKMTSIGKSMLLYNRIRTEEEVLQKIDAVTMDDVMRTIETIFQHDKMSMAMVGKLKGTKKYTQMIKNW